MEIIEGQIGPEAQYSLKFEGGMLKGLVAYKGAQMDGAFSLNYSVDSLIDAIEVAIPGKLDDAILEMLKAALKGV